jgi:hypothetical protein
MGKVPESKAVKVAIHDPNLVYQEQDSEGKVRTLFLTHPNGNRMLRRSRQRHHPFFTKDRSPGREWLQDLRARAKDYKEKSQNEKKG